MSKTAREVIADVTTQYANHFAVGESYADEIMSALDAAGFVIVPKEPTKKMVLAGERAPFVSTSRGNSNTETTYRAMIAKAQEP